MLRLTPTLLLQFDVMVTPNFYGSLVTNAVAGLIGGPGLCPGANVGATGAMFEQGACARAVWRLQGERAVCTWPQPHLFLTALDTKALTLSNAGARHVGLDIAGQDVVNPTGILLASVQVRTAGKVAHGNAGAPRAS
jgi:isocitrate/isopropylmalate dehydrogenase